MEIVTSRQNPVAQLARSLANKKYRSETGLFVAEGPLVLQRARERGWEPEFLIASEPVAPWGAARRLLVTAALMGSITGRDNPPAIIGVFRQKWAEPPREPQGTWLMLDALRDPGNLGTIIRTADAVAASGIILAAECCDPWSPDCVRATMGSIFAVPLIKITLDEALSICRSWRGGTVAADMSAATDYRRDYPAQTLLIVGGESAGVSPALRDAAQMRVSIPMPGGTESLNAAVAAALLLYEVRRSALQARDQA
jgi:TrmH family RNA methyltransferase